MAKMHGYCVDLQILLIYCQMKEEMILVTGPFGQIGSELVPALQAKYGKERVVALGHHYIPAHYDGLLEKGTVTDKEAMRKLIQHYKFTQIYHLAAVLSASGEKDPQLCYSVNMDGTKAILDLCLEFKMRAFVPSSIAAFGPTTPGDQTPQHTINEPITMYGVTKYACELLCQYYFRKYGVDVRGLRYPGILSWKASPGGGTTEYAISIIEEGILHGKYECFVNQDTTLPMMYMDDAVKATIDVMQAPSESIKVRTSYNLAAVSFSVKELYAEVRKHLPDLEISYKPDERQKNADSWPNSIDDSEARKDWGWQHEFHLSKMVETMVTNMRIKLKPNQQ